MLEAFNAFGPLKADSKEALQNIISEKKYIKGQHLLEIGQIDRYLHFIVKGSGRVYYLKDGQDVTDYFALDGGFLGGLESTFTGQASHKAMELTEDAIVQSVVYAQFEKLCDQFHDIEKMGRKLAIFAFLGAQKQIESIRFLSASERYRQLEEEYPGISNRIPLKYIASYLGTTQVSLSRIRSGYQ